MRISLALCPTLVLVAGSTFSGLQAQDTLRDALTGGTPSLNLRYRIEVVDSDKPGEIHKAIASTLRSVYGYRTASYQGLEAYFEFEAVVQTWDDLYNDAAGNGNTSYPVVADPRGTEVNQAYLDYGFMPERSLRFGRQEILLDNERFVGNVGWRQNHASYDAIRLSGDATHSVSMNYAYLHGLNTITGADLDSSAHILNLRRDVSDSNALSAYYYHLDLEDLPLLSSATLGLRYVGKSTLDEGMDLNYVVEYATQRDTGDNPNDVSADYLNLIFATKLDHVDLELGFENLEGSGSGGNKFTTPLATAHRFNGYADQFVTVPDSGLEDLSVGIGGTLAGLKCRLTYHQFQSDAGSIDYGSELDLTISKGLDENTVLGFKLAAFDADDAGTGFRDVTKAMFWTTYRVL